MNKVIKWTLIATVLAALPISVSAATKSNVNDQDPVAVLTTYFQAEQNADVQTMVELAKDARYQDTKQQKADYENDVTKNPLKNFKILSTKYIDDKNVKFLVDLHYANSPDLPPLPYKAVKENGRWDVVIESLDINMVKGSPDYGKVTVNHYETK
jgi:hypothetical protein